MSTHVAYRVLGAALCLAASMSIGCDNHAPSAPTRPPAPTGAPLSSSPLSPRIWGISPKVGSTGGKTSLVISGERFEEGATLTLGGAATAVTVLSSTVLTAMSAAHPIGTVDVVVTNAGGQSGRLTQAYTYAVVMPGPPPSIESIFPDHSTLPGGQVRITGAGFHPGAIVKINDIHSFSSGSSSTTLNVQAPSAQAPGTVDVVVMNPNGESAKLSGGFRYAAPGTLNLNGDWIGEADDLRDNHASTRIKFVVRNNQLVSLTCDGGAAVPANTTVPVVNGAFSWEADGGLTVSGTFQSEESAVGRIRFPPCELTWGAHKQR